MSAGLLNLFAKFPQLLHRRYNYLKSTGVQINHSTENVTLENVSNENEMTDTLINNENQENVQELFVRDIFHTRYYQRKKQRLLQELAKQTDGAQKNDPTLYKEIKKVKKKKVAVLLGYCGVNYSGMQRNKSCVTIEEDFFRALLEVKYISSYEYLNTGILDFQRCSRTDASVSAAGQVVSLDLPLDVNITKINSKLPSCIRVFSIKKTSNQFDAKSDCSGRTYVYNVPTYVFEPGLTFSSLQKKKAYRISAEKYTNINQVLQIYIGTKKYHNFTIDKYFHDPKANRHIWNFNVNRVYMESEMEFMELSVKGQSFMLHQIRKMVGFMIAIIRGKIDCAVMNEAFGPETMRTPTAPGLGLLLDKVHFDGYNIRLRHTHSPLEFEDVDDVVTKFKHDQIYPHIVQGEIEGDSFGRWLIEY